MSSTSSWKLSLLGVYESHEHHLCRLAKPNKIKKKDSSWVVPSQHMYTVVLAQREYALPSFSVLLTNEEAPND